MSDARVLIRMAIRHRQQWIAVVCLSGMATWMAGLLMSIGWVIPVLAREAGVEESTDSMQLPIILLSLTTVLSVAPVAALCLEAQRRDLSILSMVGSSRFRMTVLLLTQTILTSGLGAICGIGAAGVTRRSAIEYALPNMNDLHLGNHVLSWVPLGQAATTIVTLVVIGSLRPIRRLTRARRSSSNGSTTLDLIGRSAVSALLVAAVAAICRTLASGLRPAAPGEDSPVGGLVMLTLMGALLAAALLAVWGRWLYPLPSRAIARISWNTRHAIAGTGARGAQNTLRRFPTTCTAITVAVVAVTTLLGTFTTLSTADGQDGAINYGSVAIVVVPVVVVALSGAACHLVMSSGWRSRSLSTERLVGARTRTLVAGQLVEWVGIVGTALLLACGVAIPALALLTRAATRVLLAPCSLAIPWTWLLGTTGCGAVLVGIPMAITLTRVVHQPLSRVSVQR